MEVSTEARRKGLAGQGFLRSIYFATNTNTPRLENACHVGVILNCQAFSEYVHGAIRSAILLWEI